MTEHTTPKKNRLTFFIIVSLVLGIAIGFWLNKSYVNEENNRIINGTAAIENIQKQLHTISDTSTISYKVLASEKAKQLLDKNAAIESRDDKLEPFSVLADIFLRLIKMIVAPLVFTTLVVGVAKLGDIKAVGRIGGKTLLWFFAGSFVSLFIGMLLINFFKPGEAMHLPLPDVASDTGVKASSLSLIEFLYHMFPSSLFDAMARNEILQIVVFSLFFGVATAAIGKRGEIVIQAMDAIAHVILKITGYVMNFAPFAVFGAMAAVIAKQGLGILQTYSIFIIEFYLGLLILLGILLLAASFFIKGRTLTLMKRIREPVIIAFSTTSSEAAFPKTLIELERFGCNEKIVSFVLSLGYSFNLAGSMMYMTFGTLFIAQCYGIHLATATQITILLVLMLTSKGVAGVPRAALVVIAGTLVTFKLPEAGLALLFGIDPLLDMGRAAMNVIGNSLATAVVSKWEDALDD
ncbi:MAG: dicarboxylate/amino acid:cation symporter [Flavipsychrobacter sp.]